MSPYCPRCDVEFEKDLARCPGCGWDFRAHIIPEGFLRPPIDFSPLRDLGRFLRVDWPLIWINGLTVQVLWALAVLIIYHLAFIVLSPFVPADIGFLRIWVGGLAVILVLILFFPVWANYLFSLLRRYRYRVPVAYFSVLPPGRSLYAQSMTWALPCLIAGLIGMLLVIPGLLCLFVFVPMMLLIRLDKRNISSRRRAFILSYTFRRLWPVFLPIGIALAVCWGIVAATTAFVGGWLGIVLAMLLIPLQAAFATLLYESLLGRENLDVD